MGAAHLVADKAIRCVPVPFKFLAEICPGFLREMDPGVQQGLRVGLHVEALDSHGIPLAELVGTGIGPHDSAQQAEGRSGGKLPAGYQHGRGPGADGQVREIRLHLPAAQVLLKKGADRVLQQGPAVFAGNKQGMADLAAFNQPRRHHHGVHKPQAGVGNVQYLAGPRQPQQAVHVGRGGRLHAVAADAAMDQQVDFAGVDPLLPEQQLPGLRPGRRRLPALLPEMARVDAGHQFQPPLGQVEPFVKGPEPLLDVGRGHLYRRNHDSGAVDADPVEPHDGCSPVGVSDRVTRSTTASSK